jgi:hypothetical protein
MHKLERGHDNNNNNNNNKGAKLFCSNRCAAFWLAFAKRQIVYPVTLVNS